MCKRGTILVFQMETMETNVHKDNNMKNKNSNKNKDYSDMGALHTFISLIRFTNKLLNPGIILAYE